MNEAVEYPNPVSSKVTDLTMDQIREAKKRFGVTPGSLVRMALEAFMPGYLAAQGRPENVEFIAKVSDAINFRPELKTKLEAFLLKATREEAPQGRTNQRRAA